MQRFAALGHLQPLDVIIANRVFSTVMAARAGVQARMRHRITAVPDVTAGLDFGSATDTTGEIKVADGGF